jgi:hypothetical protein
LAESDALTDLLRSILFKQIFKIHEEAVYGKQTGLLTWGNESQFHGKASMDIKSLLRNG